MVESHDRHKLAYDWIQVCEKENIIITFKGDFNQDLVNAILLIAEHEPDVVDSSTIVRTRVFSIMVECMQNIRKYAAANVGGGDLRPGIILVSMKNGSYNIRTGNLVENNNVFSPKEKLEKIQSLSKEDLKLLHKSVLKKTDLSDKSGAGLGLISIARKSDNIDYQFKQLNDSISFYSLEINLSNSIN